MDEHVLISLKDLEFLIFHACGHCTDFLTIIRGCQRKCEIKTIAVKHNLDVNEIARKSE